MGNIGIGDIENFESKIRFAFMVVPVDAVVERVRQAPEGHLTAVTLASWQSGRNRPSRRKLKLVAAALNIDPADFYLAFEAFADLLCRRNKVSAAYRDIYMTRVKEHLGGRLKLSVFGRYDPAYLQRLFDKIKGYYILYNYSVSNIPRINVTLVHVRTPGYPFIGVDAKSLRDGRHIQYTGALFAVRSNLHIILETEPAFHDEVVMVMTNNPVDIGREVDFLYGVILAGSEDFVAHPSAARVFMERLPSGTTADQALAALEAIEPDTIPDYCRKLVDNEVSSKQGACVLRAEQLNIADMEMLRQASRESRLETGKRGRR